MFGALDLEKSCREAEGYTDQARTVMVTWSQGPNIAESLQGQFSIDDPEHMAHSFDGDCNHISSAQIKPQSPGFKAEVDMGKGIIDVELDCMGLCFGANPPKIGELSISGVDESADVECYDDKTMFKGVVQVYAYRTCTIAYK